MDDLLGIALRVSVSYVYVLALMRFTGKREIGQLSIPDAIAAYVVGDMFDDIFWGEVSLARGLVAAGTILLLHVVISYGKYRSLSFDRLVEGAPVLLVRAGHMVPEGLRKEHKRQWHLVRELRLQGIEDLSEEVKEARCEPDGRLSVLKSDPFKTVQKKDLPRVKELVP